MTTGDVAAEETGFGRAGRWTGLILGPALALGLLASPAPEGLSAQAWGVVALAALMVTWWITEAIPISATALLPLAALPLLGAASIKEAAAPYADPIVFLFIGGFMLAACVERWRLHERIALSIAAAAGGRSIALVAGFMAASALLSMWISNTATTLMLVPIAIGAARALSPAKPDLVLGGALVLGVAHAATIGGVGTPVGSPTNLIGMAFFERAGEPLAFAEWMTRALPMMAIMLPLAWLFLCLPLFRRGRAGAGAIGAVVKDALKALGPVTAPEMRIGAVFACVALAWMARQQLIEAAPALSGLTDSGIAIIGALALFFVPSGRGRDEKLITWRTAEAIPWGIAILFGGGLSLAAAMEATGLAQWIGAWIAGLDGVSAIGLVAILVVVTILISELASNVATLTSMLPVVAAVAAATHTPLTPLAFPVAIAASFAFMLPIATAPNAIAYSSGLVSLKRMLAVGLGLNIAAATLIIAFAAAG